MHHLQTVEIELKYKRKKNPQTVTELIECRNQTKSIFGRFKRLAGTGVTLNLLEDFLEGSLEYCQISK